MPDEKRKINCLIPTSMYEKIDASEYKNVTEAINAALEHLMNDNPDDIKCYIDEIEEYKHNIDALQAGNMSIKEEVIKLRAKSEELEKHNISLQNELEDLKKIYNNYMLQMQTLINQRALEPPAAEKKKPFWKFW
jgi:DNA repair exonuclease SbcCD ATPase subunit